MIFLTHTVRGRFITFEGLDGSGKTTQIELLAARLRREFTARLRSARAGTSDPVLIAREPGGTAVGDAIRAIVLSSRTAALDPRAEVLLYFASRAQNVSEVILPALRAGKTVLCDRFTDSSRAYQGHGRKLGDHAIDDLDRIACQGLQPDLTILLDVAHQHSVARATKRNSKAARDESRIERESAAFFRRVRKAFLAIAASDPKRVKVVNGDRSVEEIHEDIWDLIHSPATRRR